MFYYDGICIRGPEEYLDERGFSLIDSILAQEDERANVLLQGHDEEQVVILRLTEDFEVWRGMDGDG